MCFNGFSIVLRKISSRINTFLVFIDMLVFGLAREYIVPRRAINFYVINRFDRTKSVLNDVEHVLHWSIKV